MSEKFPIVSIVIVDYNGRHLLNECLDAVFTQNYPADKFEVIVVDNGSTGKSVQFIKSDYPKVKIFKNKENNYCMANNLGIIKSKGDFVVLLNNDAKVGRDWLIELVKVMIANPKAGMAGSKIIFEDGKIQSVGHIEFPNHYWADRGFLEDDNCQYESIEKVASVSNCSAMYRKTALRQTGKLDEDFVMYMEDVDISHRLAQKGWHVIYVPKSIVCHKLHGSGQKSEERDFYIEKNRLLFIAKYFPHELPSLFFGTGAILNMSENCFQIMIIVVANKLISCHGGAKAKKIMALLQKSIEKAFVYRDHSSRIILKNSIYSSEKKISDLGERLKEYENQLNAQQSELKIWQDRLSSFNEVSKVKDGQLKSQQERIEAAEKELQSRGNRLNSLDSKIKEYENQLNAQQSELKIWQDRLSNVYNSETYRFFVKPLIWPAFTFIKKIITSGDLFAKFGSRKPIKDNAVGCKVCVSQFSAKNIIVKYKHKNEYLLKLTNSSFSEEKAKVIIDIWPKMHRAHPHRHFVFFVFDVTLQPRSLVSVKLFYDWGKEVEVLIGQNSIKLLDFWRGALLNRESYEMSAAIIGDDNTVLNGLHIIQRLEI